MGRAIHPEGPGPVAAVPASADPGPADGAGAPAVRLSGAGAAAALGVPLEALRLGEVPPAPGEGAAAELVRHHAGAAAPLAVPATATRLLLLAAEGWPDAAALCRAVEADRRVSEALVARAREDAGRGRERHPGSVRSPVAQAVASLGTEEGGQLAAAWALRSVAASQGSGPGWAQGSPWPELLRGALVTARLAAALGRDARLDPDRRGELAGRAFASGLLGVLECATALRSLEALQGEGALPRLTRRAELRVVRAARVGLDAGRRRAWGLDLAGQGGAGWWQPATCLVRLAGAIDSLAQGPGADPWAAAEAFEAAGRLGLSAPALAVAVVRHRDAAAWVEGLATGV